MFDKSRCPNCGSVIAKFQDFPVFGWLFLRGRCRSCGIKISVGYPLGEAACSAIFGGIALFLVEGANDFAGINRALGLTFWLGFCALTIWSSLLFRYRKVRTPWAFRLVVAGCVATYFLPSRFLFVPFCGNAFLIPWFGQSDYFVNFLILSAIYSTATVVGLSLARDWILMLSDKTKLNLKPAIRPREKTELPST